MGSSKHFTEEELRLIQLELDEREAARRGVPVEVVTAEREAFKKEMEPIKRALREEAALLNKVSYQDFVAWAEGLSQQLPEDGPYRAAFLDGAKRRWGQVTPEDTMAVIDTVELDFQAMKRSAEYREGGGSK